MSSAYNQPCQGPANAGYDAVLLRIRHSDLLPGNYFHAFDISHHGNVQHLQRYVASSVFRSIANAQAFEPFRPAPATPTSKTKAGQPAASPSFSPLIMPMVAYVACQGLTLALGLYKCATMGILPTGTGDWLQFETRHNVSRLPNLVATMDGIDASLPSGRLSAGHHWVDVTCSSTCTDYCTASFTSTYSLTRS